MRTELINKAKKLVNVRAPSPMCKEAQSAASCEATTANLYTGDCPLARDMACAFDNTFSVASKLLSQEMSQCLTVKWLLLTSLYTHMHRHDAHTTHTHTTHTHNAHTHDAHIHDCYFNSGREKILMFCRLRVVT